jgi:hypothetical protein
VNASIDYSKMTDFSFASAKTLHEIFGICKGNMHIYIL